MYYHVFQTPIGWCGVVSGSAALQRIFLAEPERQNAEASILRQFPGCCADMQACWEAVEFIRRYFKAGAAALPSGKLDFESATVFQRHVWELAVSIPFGQVRSYGWMAAHLGRRGFARAVGSALGRNPLPLIVPCHRIVCSNGNPGGFSATGGTDLKRRLLEHEGVGFDSKGRVIM